jgi:hypothetical protein
MDRPFDARNWKTSAPVYYFEGDRDPATPMNQALYNYKAQTKAEFRKFVVVHGGGHPALTYNLSDCRPGILAEIANGGRELEAALAKCSLQTEIR